MTEDPIELDQRRDMAGREEAEVRREHLQELEANQEALKNRQEEFEQLLLKKPARTWPEVAARLQYLIQLLATTDEAQDPRRQKLIALSLDDIARLSGSSKGEP